MKKKGPVIFTREVAERYDSFYATEAGAEVDRLEKGAMDRLLERVVPSDLLEIGCGTGHWTEYFVSRGFAVTATDPSEPMLAEARRRGSAGAFIRASAEKLPFPDGAFPAAAAVTVFEFVEDPEAAVGEILRVLRPGGVFIGGFLNAASAQAAAVRATRERAAAGLLSTEEEGDVLLHARFRTEGEIRRLLSPIGRLEIRSCVHLSPSWEVLDGTPRAAGAEPAFFAVLARKEG